MLLIGACRQPTAEATPTACDGGEVRDASGTCVPEACGVGEFGDIEAADAYVREGESIQDAIDSVGSGLVALAGGWWNETVHLTSDHSGIEIQGRCRALVTIEGAEADSAVVEMVARRGNDARFAGLTLRGGTRGGLNIEKGKVRVEQVDILDSAGGGILSTNGALDLADVRIDGATAIEGGSPGYGIRVSGGSLSGSDVQITGVQSAGLSVLAGAAELSDCSIADVSPAVRRDLVFGVKVESGEAVIRGLELRQIEGYGVLALGAGAQVALERVAADESVAPADSLTATIAATQGATLTIDASRIAGTGAMLIAFDGGSIQGQGNTLVGAPSADARYSAVQVYGQSTLDTNELEIRGNALGGISASDSGAYASCTRCVIDSAAGGFASVNVFAGATANVDLTTLTDEGAVVSDVGSLLTISDSRIVDSSTFIVDSGEVGAAVRVEAGAHVAATNVRVLRSTLVGFLVRGMDASADLSGVDVRDTHPGAAGTGGYGVAAFDGASVDGRDVVVDGATGFGVLSSGGIVRLEDCWLHDVRGDGVGVNGFGALAVDGGDLSLRRCTVSDTQLVGVAAGGGASVAVTDLEVSGVQPSDSFAVSTGIEIDVGATLLAQRVSVADCAGQGLLVVGRADVSDLLLSNIARSPADAGMALDVHGGGDLTASRVRIERSSPVAVGVSGAGSLAVIDGLDVAAVTASPRYADAVGASAQLGGTLFLRRATFDGVDGPALAALDEGWLSCEECTVFASKFAGAAAIGGALSIVDTEITATDPSVSAGGGIGIYAAETEFPTALTVDGSTISGNPLAGIWVNGAATVRVADSRLVGGLGVAIRDDLWVHGNAMYATGTEVWSGASGMLIERSRIEGARDAGLLLDVASASLMDNAFFANGTDVVQQGCGVPVDLASLGGASHDICAGDERPVLSLVYDIYLVDPAIASE